jgi:hypothetical protein
MCCVTMADARGDSIWTHELLVPAYVALASSLLLGVQAVYRSVKSKRNPTPAPNALDVYTSEKSYVDRHGGPTVLGFEAFKFLSSLSALAFSVTSLLTDNRVFTSRGELDIPSRPSARARFLHLSVILPTAYATLLLFLSLLSRPSRSLRLSAHSTSVLFVLFIVYSIRDIWPLATFTLSPKDTHEGWLLWARYAALALSGVVLPLTVPRRYIPVDPHSTSNNPTAEQTASWLSLLLYSFLDPLVFRSNSSTQLTEEEIPPLSDTDAAPVLVAHAYPILDPFSGAPRSHVAFGLLRVFKGEWVLLSILILGKVVSNFAAPLGINQLLQFLEARAKGEMDGVTVRPWVWALWLFLGPLLGAITFQAYIFLNTRTMVRTEAILTQLVFDHALRVRMKAEAGEVTTAPPTRAASPERKDSISTSSNAGDDDEETSTLLAASSSTVPGSTQPDLSKGKGRVGLVETSDASSSTAISAAGSAATASTSASATTNAKAKDDDEGASANLVGKINNLVTTDLGNITDGRDFLMVILWAPLELALSMWFLYHFLGWSSLVGLGVMVLLLPLPGYLAKKIQTVQVASMKKVCFQSGCRNNSADDSRPGT